MRPRLSGTRLPRIRLAALAAGIAVAAAGCDGPQRMLDARGPAAQQIATLWWVLLGLATFVCIAIGVLLLIAIQRARRRRGGTHVAEVNGRRLVWICGVAVPLVLLFTALLYSFALSRDVYPPRDMPDEALTVHVTGHQFWWEVRFPQYGVSTANEFHIPTGRPVRLLVESSDVIHSFWLPQLQGKIDMVPGRTHTWWMQADTPGVFRGQCAEFCGLGHALMAFQVTAVPPDRFDAWLNARAPSPSAPLDETARRGRVIFEAADCSDCHSTRDAPLPEELASVAPDLSDFAARSTIAAGRAPNTPEALARFIADPAAMKPGVRMPGTLLGESDMAALITYLYTLH